MERTAAPGLGIEVLEDRSFVLYVGRTIVFRRGPSALVERVEGRRICLEAEDVNRVAAGAPRRRGGLLKEFGGKQQENCKHYERRRPTRRRL